LRLLIQFVTLFYNFEPQYLNICMEKVDLTLQFAYRLREAMIHAGYNSQRSPTGVDISKLAEITGYSLQICRKYLRGNAIPEPSKLITIAEALKVPPGWLLFGDSGNETHSPKENILIKKNLLRYIFMQAHPLYNASQAREEISDFLMDVASDVSQINADESQSKKIINLALSSAKYFSHDGT